MCRFDPGIDCLPGNKITARCRLAMKYIFRKNESILERPFAKYGTVECGISTLRAIF